MLQRKLGAVVPNIRPFGAMEYDRCGQPGGQFKPENDAVLISGLKTARPLGKSDFIIATELECSVELAGDHSIPSNGRAEVRRVHRVEQSICVRQSVKIKMGEQARDIAGYGNRCRACDRGGVRQEPSAFRPRLSNRGLEARLGGGTPAPMRCF